MGLEHVDPNEWYAVEIEDFSHYLDNDLSTDFLEFAKRISEETVSIKDIADAKTIAKGIEQIDPPTLVSALTAADSINEAVIIIKAIQEESQKDADDAYIRGLKKAKSNEENDGEEVPNLKGLLEQLDTELDAQM